MKVFISRDVVETSPVLTTCQENGIELHATSLMEFTSKKINFRASEYDWLFFYSQKGVAFFLPQVNDIATVKVAALGPSTARQLRLKGVAIDYEGSGKPREVASSFLALAKGQRVGFVQAVQSRKSVQLLTEGQLQDEDMVVYDNQMKRDVVVPTCDVYCFTSPLNVKAFFASNTSIVISAVIFVAIGETTANALRVEGVDEVEIVDEPSEVSIAEKILAIKKAKQ